MKRIESKIIIAVAVALMTTIFLSFKSSAEKTETPLHQLRIYQVPEKNLQAFHDRFRDHAHRIMKKYGFKIIALWDSKNNGQTEFVYLLEWKDQKTMEESWKNFMADNEWKEIKKATSEAHGTFVDSIVDRTLIPTNYSPNTNFLK